MSSDKLTQHFTQQAQFTHYQQRNNDQLRHRISELGYPSQMLIQAMEYGALLGGKRIRPFLVYAVGTLFGAHETDLDTPATAIECIHAYSLIHDDLPAMDDDELRRGQPTCHIAFDQAHAILAGDALNTFAFEILAKGELSAAGEPYRIEMIKALAQSAGASGMCLGQALDLAAENQEIELYQLENIHNKKTGALIHCAVLLGAFAAGKEALVYRHQLERFARAIGLAFQVQDDILDIIGDTTTLGKPQGSDLAHNKSTYPALLGLNGAQIKASQLYDTAIKALQEIPYNTEMLQHFARYVIERKN